MTRAVLAPHETMELHEMINFKTICLAKSKLMQGLCFDKDLKAILQKDVELAIPALQDLISLYQRAPFASPPPYEFETPFPAGSQEASV